MMGAFVPFAIHSCKFVQRRQNSPVTMAKLLILNQGSPARGKLSKMLKASKMIIMVVSDYLYFQGSLILFAK
jgi:hypothetical protein